MSNAPLPLIYLARHGETAWTISGQHTGRSDIPLTANGENDARKLGLRLKGITFDKVLTSPLQRARATCELAGFGKQAEEIPDLMEWDYGEYDGRTTAEIRSKRPLWNLFVDGFPGGESLTEITERADRVVKQLRSHSGNTLIFSHGHFLRILATRWLFMPLDHARFFILKTTSLSVLGYEKNLNEPAIHLWNENHHES